MPRREAGVVQTTSDASPSGRPPGQLSGRDAGAMAAQQGNGYLVAELGGEVVGCLQLTVIAGLSRMGATRAQLEGVRIGTAHRGCGLGTVLVREAVARARRAGCALMQLTTDAQRADARRFYTRLGFRATHVGMKLPLDTSDLAS